jgi:hypothetical protein
MASGLLMTMLLLLLLLLSEWRDEYDGTPDVTPEMGDFIAK